MPCGIATGQRIGEPLLLLLPLLPLLPLDLSHNCGPRVAWVDFDLFDPRFHDDPYPHYAAMREEGPVHQSPLGSLVFTRHRECQAILRDRRMSSDQRNADPEVLSRSRASSLLGPDDPLGEALSEMAPFLFRDPPDHTRLRGLVQKAFTPRVVEGMQPFVERVVDELLERAFEEGEVDLVASYAYPLPVRVIAELLGVPPDDQERFEAWSHALARGVDPELLLPPEAVQERLEAILSFVKYFSELLDDRRRDPGDDLLSGLIAAEEAGEVLTQGEMLSTCILLLVAGHETTVNLISGALLALVEHPDQMAALKEQAGIERRAVEEMLRFVSPVQLTGRVALEDVEIAGAKVAKGHFATVLIGSANRDSDVFEDPERFDLTREDNPHLGFGFGIHHCLGGPLARLEARVAVPALVRRARRIELVTDHPAYKDNLVLRGLAELPAVLEPV